MSDIINSSSKGMNRDKHPMSLNRGEYPFAMNANIQGEVGNGIPVIQNEHSNILCKNFGDKMKVVGFKYDPTTMRTYFFVTNPYTNHSAIGYIEDVEEVTMPKDLADDCGCDFSNILAEPLEDSDHNSTPTDEALDDNYTSNGQIPICEFVTLVDDECNSCLNFSVDFPIKDGNIVLKKDACGDTMYWTDAYNPPRYLNVDAIDKYKKEGIKSCGYVPEDTCLDCSKLEIFKMFDKPCLELNEVGTGNLEEGIYEVLIAYCDAEGRELSSYYSITNTIDIFDSSDLIVEQAEEGRITSKGISVRIKGIDERCDYFKLAVITSSDVNKDTSYYTTRPFNKRTDIVHIPKKDILDRTTLNHILRVKPSYILSEGLTESGGLLYHYGLKSKEDVNLQPIANLLGLFLNYGISIADEDIYKNNSTSADYVSYMRGEVYPFAIRFTSNGYQSPIFPLISRPATAADLVVHDNNDVDSLSMHKENCSTEKREQEWELYDTSEVVGECDHVDLPTTVVHVTNEINCVDKTVFGGEVDVTFNSDIDTSKYKSLLDVIHDFKEEICTVGHGMYNSVLCFIINKDNYNTSCSPDNEDGCTIKNPPVRKNTVVDSITDEVVTVNYNEAVSSYLDLPYEPSISIFKRDLDAPINNDYIFFPNTVTDDEIFVRTNTQLGYGFNSSKTLLYYDSTSSQLVSNFTRPLVGDKTAAGLANPVPLTTIPQIPAASGRPHKDFVTKNAAWFNGSFNGEQKIILEITEDVIEITTASEQQLLLNSIRNKRVISTYNNTSITSPTSYVTSGVYDEGATIKIILDRADYDSDNFLVAIDYGMDKIVDTVTNEEQYVSLPSVGSFGIALRYLEVESVNYYASNMTVDLVSTFEVSCNKDVIVGEINCGVIPLRYGKFSYWESETKYPDNSELYDSSKLKISVTDISDVTQRELFITSYVDTTINNDFVLSNDADFTCSNIRHFKFPENDKEPFMQQHFNVDFAKSHLYIMGVRLDSNIVNDFLDIAVKNRLITEEYRKGITDYEILRGDRTISKSILAKGLMYDINETVREDEENIFYSNYPYNDLGVDNFLNIDSPTTTAPIRHKYLGVTNDKFTFDSPDTIFYDFDIPREFRLEGYTYGKSRGQFNQVKVHPSWVMLSPLGDGIAKGLGIAQATLEIAVNSAEYLLQSIYGGWSGEIQGTILAVAASVAGIAQTLFRIPTYQNEWRKIFINLGTPYNFAHYYSSYGWHNFYRGDLNKGDIHRGTYFSNRVTSGYWDVRHNQGNETFSLNHKDRSKTVVLVSNMKLPVSTKYHTYDNSTFNPTNSSRFTKFGAGCKRGREEVRNIASRYASLRVYRPNQYGAIDSIQWLPTGKCLKFDGECNFVYGGDTYISRYAYKRKFPFFTTTAIGQSEDTAFRYSYYNNIGKPKRFVDFRYKPSLLFPRIGDTYSLECLNLKSLTSLHLGDQSAFYLYNYGIPSMLVESTINLNFRTAKKDRHELFYPMVGSYVDWTQEGYVSIREDNTLFYNTVFSKVSTRTSSFTLPESYSKELYDCLYDLENGVIYSDIDSSEIDITDPYLSYRALNRHTFDSSYGKLIDLRGIGRRQIIGRFTNQSVLFNSVERRKDTIATQEIGNGSVFSALPMEYYDDSLGFGGSINKAMLSTPFGHFWTDAVRGTIIKVNAGGRGMTAITSGMSNWFAEHLPFKVLRGVVDGEVDLDNNFKYVGITMGYDMRFKRVFLTKRDIVPKEDLVARNGILYTKQDFDDIVSEAESDNPNFLFSNVSEDNYLILKSELDSSIPHVKVKLDFYELPDDSYIDASFTVSYSDLTKTWISYYSFKPNYYVSMPMHFNTGINFSKEHAVGLWSHLITNKSYQVFYGKLYPFIIEPVIQEKTKQARLNSFKFLTDVFRYHNEYDYATIHNVTFNKAIIYNYSDSSGLMHIDVANGGSLRDRLKYPMINNDKSTTIQASRVFDVWSINSFYNRTRGHDLNIPTNLGDINDIEFTVNPSVIEHNSIQNRMRGDWFLARLSQDKESRFKYLYKWSIASETFSDK